MEPSSSLTTRISVSIVVFNSALELLQKTLLSLGAAIAPVVAGEFGSVDITVVDNGSDDGYGRQLSDLLRQLREGHGIDVELLTLPCNRGFGAGHNCVISRNPGDFNLILNPDVELAPDALSRAVRRLRGDEGLALLSPFALGRDGHQEFLCKRPPSVFVLCLRAFFPAVGRRFFPSHMSRYEMSDVCGTESEVKVPLVSGCFMLARGGDLQRLGGFDERYFLYFEDFDLSLRLGELGSVMYVPEVRIVHHGGYAASKGWRHLGMFMRSGLRYFQQHGWRWI